MCSGPVPSRLEPSPMKVCLLLQDPGRNSRYAIDVIGAAARGASHGVAMFAFATVSGVDLLLDHPSIRALTATGTFELIVGIDAITNRETLERLLTAAGRSKGLRPRVFWNSSEGLFHPKLCWFRASGGEALVVGSSNLTPRGLRDSYEAVACITGKRGALTAVTSEFRSFLDAHRANIREIDHRALARASKNTFARAVAVIEPPPAAPPRRSRVLAGESRALVAELPRGGDRWQQANFDYETARDFFEVEPYNDSRDVPLLLNEVTSAGVPVSQEPRRFTFTQSRNLRLQLGAHPGTSYPARGRPIAIFRRVKPRHFRYQVLLPGDPGFQLATSLLTSRPASGIRRMITTVDALRKAWPRCPL